MERKRSGGSGPSATMRKRLSQIQACEKSGEPLKAYAARHGVSVHTLYQAKKMARRHGWLPPYRGGKTKPARRKAARPARFVEATSVTTLRPPVPAWRLRFAGGEVLESSTPLDGEVALRLVESLGGRS
jgi:hypothetical protein